MKNDLSTQLLKANSSRTKELALVYKVWESEKNRMIIDGVHPDKIDSELTKRYSGFVKRACLRSLAREPAFGHWLKCNAADSVNLFVIGGLSTFLTKIGIDVTGWDEAIHNFKLWRD